MKANVSQILKDSGYKLTRQRKAIIEALQGCDKPLTALELLGLVKRRSPSVSHDTLYRNLEMLCSVNVVNRIWARGGDLFELERHHHHHFMCLACGEVTCLDGCPIGPEQTAEARERGFDVLYHNFMLSGYCTKCK